VYNGYDKVEKDKKAYERSLYSLKISKNMSEIGALRTKKKQMMQQREELLNKREEFLKDQNIGQGDDCALGAISQIKTEIGSLENQIMSL
jgi:hypothetical protein